MRRIVHADPPRAIPPRAIPPPSASATGQPRPAELLLAGVLLLLAVAFTLAAAALAAVTHPASHTTPPPAPATSPATSPDMVIIPGPGLGAPAGGAAASTHLDDPGATYVPVPAGPPTTSTRSTSAAATSGSGGR